MRIQGLRFDAIGVRKGYKMSYRIDDKSTTQILIDSEEFSGLHYRIKDGHVILIGGASGIRG